MADHDPHEDHGVRALLHDASKWMSQPIDEDRTQPYANSDIYMPGQVTGLPVDETARLTADSEARPHHSSRSHSKGKSRSKSASRSPHRSRPVGRAAEDLDNSGDEGPDRSDTWDNMRDGSISRRPAWQRPSPRWVLPFILGATVSMGMTLAPRAELYTDLACLVHPPRMPDSASVVDVYANSNSTSPHNPPPLVPAPGPLPTDPVMSPGDKWFSRAQRDVYRYLHPELPEDNDPIPLPSDPNPTKGREKHPKTPGGDDKMPSPFPEIDPARCKSDDGVQRVAARLTMVLAMTGGIVSATTTGFWASKSDRVGRRKIFSLLEFGFLVNDACFLFITSHPAVIARFGLYILLIGPFLEGLLGGLPAHMATMHAYISDVTPDGSRATHFGRLFGALMGGLAAGPILGSMLIEATGNILSPFYITIAVHLIFVILLRFLLPESLSSESRAHLKKRAYAAREAARERNAAEREWEQDGDDIPVAGDSGFSRITTPMRRYRTSRRAAGTARRTFRTMFSFLEPLEMFIPRADENGHKDWNLPLFGLMHAVASIMLGVQQMKALYTQKAFGWKPDQLGPFMTFMGSLRLLVLVGLTPLLMYFIKPFFTEKTVIEHQGLEADTSPLSSTRSASPRPPVTETSGLLEPGARATGRSFGRVPRSPSTSPVPKKKGKRSAMLDLVVLRGCIVIESTCWLGIGLNKQHSVYVFLIGSAIMTLGAPASPASNSLVLNFAPNKREVGRLFGALGVLHALGSALFAPLIFANLYSATVDTYPPAIFLVASGMLMLEGVVSLFIRLPKNQEEIRGRGRGRRGSGV